MRQSGKSYAHPLIVLIVAESEHSSPRVGLVVGRSLGGAVQRNRAKRRLRAAIQSFMADIVPGRDLILIARAGLLDAPFVEIQTALQGLLRRAGLLASEEHGLPTHGLS